MKIIIKKYHYVYKIINKVNGKFYIGVRSTNDMNDGYMGSGIAINKAIKTYGKENFIKEILKEFDSREEASDYEKQLVNIDLIKNKKCYNIRTGGDNKFIIPCTIERNLKISKSKLGKPRSEETKKKVSDTIKKRIQEGSWITNFKGKTHTTENKIKQSKRMKGKYSGEKNPMYGKTHSPEVRKFLSDNNKGRSSKGRITEKGREKLSKIHKGKIVTNYTRKKMSAAKKGKFVDEKNNNAKSIICIETGENFLCMKYACKKLNISAYKLRNLIKQNKFKYV